MHIPFCVSKCHYCDFVSYGLRSSDVQEQDMESYLSALIKEAKLYEKRLLLSGAGVTSLYIGGGTPTCLTGGQLCYLLKSLQALFTLTAGVEITVEGNPGTLDKKKLQDLRRCGCSRLSLGVQSFDRHELKVLGRIHSPRDVYNTFKLAREAGFENISIDLMYGLPGQDLAGWRRNLQAAVKLGPEHISLYQLNIEKGTPFYRALTKGLMTEFKQETALLMYEEAIDFLASAGYGHYEISNFARPGQESIHNKLYWRHQEYLGLGAGASGYLERVRYTNIPGLEAYQEAVLMGRRPVQEEEIIDESLAMSEMMFLGLRLLQGVDKERFLQLFDITVSERYGVEIAKLKKLGLLEESRTHIYLTKKGLPLANAVFMEFLN